MVGTDIYTEPWVDSLYNDTWMKYRISLNCDGTVSFFRSDTLRWTSSDAIDLEQYINQAMAIDGRSSGAYQIVDEVVFFAEAFLEDWESGISSTVWKSWGSPLPEVLAGEGRGGSSGLNPNGDSNYQSGIVSYANYDLSTRPMVHFWAKGNHTQVHFQNIRVGWADTTSEGFSGTEAQPQFLCNIYIAAENGHGIQYMVGTDMYVEPWVDSLYNEEWMNYLIRLNADGTVSFFRNNTLRWTSTDTIILDQYTEQALALDGRSVGAYQIIDDVSVCPWGPEAYHCSPAVIADLRATLSDDAIHLDWSEINIDECGDPALIDYYIVHRSTTPGFEADPADSIGGTVETYFLDTTAAVDSTTINHYYIVKAVDTSKRQGQDSNQVGEFDQDMINGE
jgi:hypothetical protein